MNIKFSLCVVCSVVSLTSKNLGGHYLELAISLQLMATPKRKKPEDTSPQKRGGSKKVKQVSEKCILCHKEAKQDAVVS